MKRGKCNLIILLAIVLSLFLVVNCTTVYAADAPAMWVSPTETNNIPIQIDVFQGRIQTGGSYWNPTYSYTYQVFLPGNANLADCFLSWNDDLQVTVDGLTYSSGNCPIPPLETEKNYVFSNGASITMITYQGSSSVIPVFIDIDESYTTVENGKDVVHTIAAMDNDTEHEKYCVGSIYINGTLYEMPKIKGRGNATWQEAKDKKPYNITLDSKIKFPGIDSPATKKWTLLAENLDHSLLGNRSGYWLAHELGIGQDTASADVWMNGEYQGCYTVTPKYDSFVTKNGYLIEQDNYLEPSVANGGDPQFTLNGLKESSGWSSCYNRITVKNMGDNLLKNADGVVDESPENMEAVAGQIQIWLQDAWDAMRSDTGYNSKGIYYTDYIDIESFAKMYLMQEYVKSYDVCAGSIFYHRDGMSDSDKLIAGPLWDLDNAMGSTYRNSSLGLADDRKNGDRRSGEGFFISNVTEYKTSVYKTLSIHEDFMQEVKKQYNLYRSEFNDLASDVRQMISEIEASARMNHMKVTDLGHNTGKNNHYYGSNTSLGSGIYEQTYLATTNSKTDWGNYVANLITYITTRSLWFENNICTHDYQEVSGSAIAATCTEAGKAADMKCSICDHVITGAEIPATGHTEEILPEVPATCTESGKTEGKKCSVCGSTLTAQETVPALGHDYQDVAGSAKAATCTVNGKEIDKKCSRCEDVITGTTIPALGHNYGAPVYAWSSDYSQMTATRTCARDTDHVDTETVNATSMVTKQATCEEKGETTYTAVFTNSAFATQTEPVANIPAIGHKWGGASYVWSADNSEVTATRICENDSQHTQTEVVDTEYAIVTEATETTAGTGKYTSKSFSNTAFAVQEKTVVIPPTGYQVSYVWANDNSSVTGTAVPYNTSAETITETVGVSGVVTKEATCTDSGIKTWTTAAFTNSQFSVQTKSETIPVEDHTVVTDVAVAATCTEGGLTEGSHCSVCGKVIVEQKPVSALGHDMKDVAGSAKEATCTENGKEIDRKCSRCQVTVTGETIPATGHNYGTPAYTWVDDNSKVTATRTCANDTTHVETETVSATYEIVKPATETASGTGKYTSGTFTNTAFAAQTKEIVIPPTGYAVSYSWSADNSKVTGKAVPYDTSKETVTETVNATFTETKKATCTETGSGTWKSAAFNGSMFSVQSKEVTVPATGHTEVGIPAVAATCTETGLTAGLKCSVCGVILKEQEEAAALGHIYEASFTWTGNDDDGYTAAVADFECKNDSVHKATVKADISNETDAASGVTTYTATAVLDGRTYTDTKTVVPETAPSGGDTPSEGEGGEGGDTPAGGGGAGGGGGGGGGAGGGGGETEIPEEPVPEAPPEEEVPTETVPVEERFKDVKKDDYFYEAVGWAAENNITSGVSEDKFGPAMDCSRAQVVTFLWLASSSPDAGTETGFDDVDLSAYYDKAVAWAVEQGITAGTAEGQFSPDMTVTRAQFITMLWVSQGKPEVECELPFADVSEDSYYAKAVAWAYTNGITAGKSATAFGPDDPCTRGQIVVFLHQTFAEEQE